MSLKIIRLLQRVVGILLLGYGIYLIFGTQDFFGTILIILAFLIFPSLNKEKGQSHGDRVDTHDQYHNSSVDHDTSSGGGDSNQEGGD
ncbi:hypothetical protein [Neobacillus jeddahensis]|uniref:hypothetical protein n=1 Tax=Neobacillus jeddahensis TaxID=1461580 RepID=UPI000590D6E9|nr:hypothetical protein [Neobacillus jeddahensis]